MDQDEAANARLETKLRAWLATNLPNHASTIQDESLSIFEILKSGVILCEMMNVIKPGSMRRISTINTAYKQLENVQNYLNMCKIMGMQASQLFESSDLVNAKFKTSILINLKTLQGIYERYGHSASKSATSTDSAASTSTSTSGAGVATANAVQPALASQKSVSSTTSSIPTSTHTSSTSKLASHPSTSSTTASAPDTKSSAPEPDIIRNVVAIKPEDRTVALVQRWIEVLLTLRCPAGKTLFDWLKPGVILLRVLNAVRPGLAKQIYDGSIGYKQIENVQRYLKLCPMASSSAVPLFSVADLTDEMNLSAVISHLHAMITIIQRDPKWTGPTLESVSHSVGSDSSAPSSPREPTAPSSSAPIVETATSSTAPSSSTPSSTASMSTASSSATSSAPLSREASAALATAAASASAIEQLNAQIAQAMEAERIRLEEVAAAEANRVREAQRQEAVQREVETREQMQTAVRLERERLRQEQEDLEELMVQTMKNAAALQAERQRNELRAAEKAAEVVSSEKRLRELALQEAEAEAALVNARLAREHQRRTSESEEIDRARRQLDAERQAMAEERRQFAERMQEETDRRLKEMTLKLEQETAAVISRERSKSQAISEKLVEERRERERVAKQLEQERRDRLVLLEESERQKVELTLTAQKQMQAVADRLQEETSKRLEAMASKITSEAMQKAEQELRRKDEHLMKQLERERKLRSRLDALEEEKKSLSRTFEKKFASLETELKTAKTRTNTNSITSPTLAASNGASSSGPTTHVDPDTLDEFRAWNNRWRINRKLTKQLTRTLTEIESTLGNGEIDLQLSLDTDDERPLDLITPRSDASEDLSARESTSHSDIELSSSPNPPLAQHSVTSHTETINEDETDAERTDAGDEDELDLEGKGWLDDDWSEEEDWESERSDFDEEDDEDATSPKKRDGADSETSESPRPASSKNKTTSPLKDDWSEFSSVKLSRYA